MLKKFAFLVVLLLASLSIVAAGCSMIPNAATPASANPKISKKFQIASRWQIYQLSVDIPPETDLPIVLRLVDGDKVDGYWYVEKGGKVDFSIKGNTLMYQMENLANGTASSDRFSFTATQAQGTTYTIDWKNNGDPTKKEGVSLFIELIYPKTGEIFTSLEAK